MLLNLVETLALIPAYSPEEKVNVFPLRFGLIALALIQWILMRGVADGMAWHPRNLAISKG